MPSTDADFCMKGLGTIGALTDDCFVFFKLDSHEGAGGAESSSFTTAVLEEGFFCDCRLFKSFNHDGLLVLVDEESVDEGMTGTPRLAAAGSGTEERSITDVGDITGRAGRSGAGDVGCITGTTGSGAGA